MYENRSLTYYPEVNSGSCCHVDPYEEVKAVGSDKEKAAQKFNLFKDHCSKYTLRLGLGFPFCAITEHQSFCLPSEKMRKCKAYPSIVQ